MLINANVCYINLLMYIFICTVQYIWGSYFVTCLIGDTSGGQDPLFTGDTPDGGSCGAESGSTAGGERAGRLGVGDGPAEG